MMKRILLALAVIAAFTWLVGCPKPGAGKQPVEMAVDPDDAEAGAVETFSAGVAEVDKLAPDFSVLDVDGNEVTKDDFSGRILILDFWATWCTGCVKKLNEYKPIYAEYKDKGVELLAVSFDSKPEVAKGGAKQHDFPYPVVMANKELQLAYLGEEIVIPQVRIIDRDGNLRYEFNSDSTVADLELALATLVDETVGGDESVTEEVLEDEATSSEEPTEATAEEATEAPAGTE